MHYYPHNIADYTLDTAHLEPLEDLAYRRLLDLYYSTEQPIPLETQSVSRRLRLGFEVVEKVLLEFFERREDGWHQSRCDEEIANYHRKAEAAKSNGRAGGRPKKTQLVSAGFPEKTQLVILANPAETKSVSFANPAETGSKANQELELEPEPKREQPRARGEPPTVEEVKAFAETVMASAECAEKFWNGCEAVGWVSRHGQPIADWRPLFRNFASSWKANEAQRSKPPNGQPTTQQDFRLAPDGLGGFVKIPRKDKQ